MSDLDEWAADHALRLNQEREQRATEAMDDDPVLMYWLRELPSETRKEILLNGFRKGQEDERAGSLGARSPTSAEACTDRPHQRGSQQGPVCLFTDESLHPRTALPNH